MENPLVSVVMSIYKEPIDWIVQSIDSILSQTYSNLELFIVCDNPDYEEGLAILKKYQNKDTRISIVVNKKNIGLTCSLNSIIPFTSGDFIARMDADDISMPNRFEKQIDFFMNHPDCELCHTGIRLIDEQGIETKEGSLFVAKSSDYLMWQNIITHPSVMMRRSILSRRSPLYNESFRRAQDYELWTFLFAQGVDIQYINEPLINYRHSLVQITKQYGSEQFLSFQKARLNFISSFLQKLHILIPHGASTIEIIKILTPNSHLSIVDTLLLARFKYLIYYNSVSKNKILLLHYLFDSNHFLKKFGIGWYKHLITKAFNVSNIPTLEFDHNQLNS